jgi:hypothetical protein
MTENRSSQGSGQGPASPSGPDSFIEDVFGPYAAHAWIGYSGNGMAGSFYTPEANAAFPPDQAHYVCCALMRTGAKSRENANFAAGILVVIDDVMAISMVGNPKQVPKDHVDTFLPVHTGCYITETSKGNFQYTFRIKPETDFVRWTYFQAMMKLDPIYGASAKQGDPVHYYRQPGGINPKNGFATRLVQKWDGYEWELDDLAEAFGIDMSDAAVASWKGQRPAMAVGEQSSPEVLTEIMKLIPNDSFFDDRLMWASIGFALKNASNDDPEIRDLWIDWDRPSSPAGGDAERFWDTATDPKAGLSTLRKEIERRYGVGSVERIRVGQLCSRDAFDEIPDETGMPAPAPPIVLKAKPFVFGDPKLIPPRDWLYGTAYMRRFVFGLVSPGGVGKTSLTLVEAVAMASGKPLLGVKPRKRLKVWIWNGEDPVDEIERRLAAVMIHYGLTQQDIDGYLFVSSGRDLPIVIAKVVEGSVKLQEPVVEGLVKEIKARQVDVMVLDPFISCHEVPENANDAIDKVVKKWGVVADRANCAILLPHHVRKAAGGVQGTPEPSADDARGATAYRDALRGLRVAAPMSGPLRDKVANPRSYFRVVDAKLSMAPARDGDDWYKFVSVGLGNGDAFPTDGGDPIPEDSVGVVEKWVPPSLQVSTSTAAIRRAQDDIGSGLYRGDIRSPDWVGRVIAKSLGLDIGDGAGWPRPRDATTNDQRGNRSKVTGIIGDWIKAGHLKEVSRPSGIDRKEKVFIEIGELCEILENVVETDDPDVY